jgi:hypothetical protein
MWNCIRRSLSGRLVKLYYLGLGEVVVVTKQVDTISWGRVLESREESVEGSREGLYIRDQGGVACFKANGLYTASGSRTVGLSFVV